MKTSISDSIAHRAARDLRQTHGAGPAAEASDRADERFALADPSAGDPTPAG